MQGGSASPEDIVSKLEALRKRVPEEKPKEPPKKEDKRKKLVRIVGILVIILIIGAIFLLVYKFIYLPKQIEKQKEIKQIEAAKIAFATEKQKKINEIKSAFAGLPVEYKQEMYKLIGQANKASSAQELNAIDYKTPATEAWRAYTLEKLDDLLQITQNIKMKLNGKVYRDLDEIRMKINTLQYADLKKVELSEVKYEYVPVRLPRDQAAGGLVVPGDYLNIYYLKSENETICIVRDAKVVAILRGKSEEISLTEEKQKYETGGGVEGYGTVPSLSIGSTSASLSGEFEGSAGLKKMETKVTYSVNINEILKALAVKQLPEEIEKDLENYGITLTRKEIVSATGDLDVEYLMLLEVTDEEAPLLVSKLLDSQEKSKIFATISKTPSWAS